MFFFHRMHKAEQDGCSVVDCILYVQKLHVTYRCWYTYTNANRISGWSLVNEDTYLSFSTSIPPVTSG